MNMKEENRKDLATDILTLLSDNSDLILAVLSKHGYVEITWAQAQKCHIDLLVKLAKTLARLSL